MSRRLKEGKQVEFTDVFVAGSEGYPVFRIPAVTRTMDGTILAFAEGRASIMDAAENDIVLKRSTDGGRTWGPLQVVASDGRNSLNNPQVVVVRETGRIVLFFQDIPYPCKERDVGVGYEGDDVQRTYETHSDDDGVTWSEWRDLTRVVKAPEWWTTTASGPGVGVQLTRGPHAGRVLMPFNHGPYWDWGVYAVYSDDGGETWARGEDAPIPEDASLGPNEVQFFERSDGSVVLNARSYVRGETVWGKMPCRVVAASGDGGQSWSPVVPDFELVEPMCQGSVLRYDFPGGGSRPDTGAGGFGRVLFSNPASLEKRTNGTLRASFDDGETWPVKETFWPGPFAYSCLVPLPDDHVGCLFEGGVLSAYERIVFARLDLGEITRV
ncbi:MAG: sialidase family protein [Promethearchaeota archaeon]